MKWIRPTTRGWMLCGGGLVWLLAALINHTVFAMLLAWFCISMVLVSFVWALFSLAGYSLRRSPCGNLTAGQVAVLPLLMENKAPWRRQPAVVLEKLPFTLEKTAIHTVPSAAGKAFFVFNRQVLAVRRGEHKLRKIVLRSGDPAGLFIREKRFRQPAPVVVYPPVEKLPDLMLYKHEVCQAAAGDPLGSAGTSQDFYGVREYTPSDGMRYIHWRSSAKYGKFMVKEFQRNAVTSVAIFLDGNIQLAGGTESSSNLEYLIRMAASINAYCGDLYCTLGFAAGGGMPVLVPPRAASENYGEIMHNLAVMRPGNVRLTTAIAEIQPRLPSGTVIFCLSMGDENVQLRSALEALTDKGMDVRWFCAKKEDFTGRNRKKQQARTATASLQALRVTPDMTMAQALAARR